MVENLRRKLILIGTLLAVSLGLLFIPDQPFRLGLDLEGGTRLVYRFEFDEEDTGPGGSSDQKLNQTIDVISRRVDPDGVLEPIIRRQGSDRVVIELPGTAAATGVRASGTLQEPLAPLSAYVALDDSDPDAVEAFPPRGGVIRIGVEKIRYRERTGNRLRDIERQYQGTPLDQHAAGEAVTLVSTNRIQNAIENLGRLAFRIVAQTESEMVAERDKLEAWVEANPGVKLSNFNAVPPEQGGPSENIAWYPESLQAYLRNRELEPDAPDPGELARAIAVVRPQYLNGAPQSDPGWDFTGADLGAVFPTSDQNGFPAVGFQMKSHRRGAFGDFTGEYVGRQMAIVLNDQVESAPKLKSRLTGSSIIEGRFKAEQVKELVTVLETGSLPIRPILEAEERVGPTLGAGYVKRGLYGGLIALASILAFMTLYFRRLGFFSVVSLAASLLMLMGGLAFLRATLTLPGVAGIILTVGMAVDANILIFDRIREEMGKGRNLIQASKNGFDQARSAILDANLTTLITALILYNVGTGPIRGFAVTLSIGIVTSVFAALVLTRVLVHMHLEGKRGLFQMGQWMVEAKYDFLSKSKLALTGSVVAILAGLGLFISLPDSTRLGIDFLGGATVQFRTKDAEDVEEMRRLIAQIPGDIGASAEVKPILSTASGDGYRSFRATFKSTGERADDDIGGGDTFQVELQRALAGRLQEDPIDVSLTTDESGANRVEMTLHFEEQHGSDDVSEVLASLGLREAVVTTGPGPGDFRVTATTVAAVDELALAQDVEQAFTSETDSRGLAYVLAGPISESSVVGAQVVGELKDKAILALVISLFAIVMYIRVRFAEYSYGFAAVAALVHDVLITLGVLAVVMVTGVLQVEINLPLIAAFLTIIGYSLNDTIVLFDRVRENLPRVEGSLSKVLNLSINQTLSRTILTSLTTLLAVGILFGFNVGTGNVLEGFSMAMVIGVLVGTYSSIFVAAPVFLWLESRAQRRAEASAEDEKKGKTSAPAASAS